MAVRHSMRNSAGKGDQITESRRKLNRVINLVSSGLVSVYIKERKKALKSYTHMGVGL